MKPQKNSSMTVVRTDKTIKISYSSNKYRYVRKLVKPRYGYCWRFMVKRRRTAVVCRKHNVAYLQAPNKNLGIFDEFVKPSTLLGFAK
jgi:hypothetical protein